MEAPRRQGGLSAGACPACGRATWVALAEQPPWCTACEHGLDTPDPSHRDFGFAWLDRAAARLAFSPHQRMYRDLAAGSLQQPGLTVTRLAVLIASAVLFSAVLAVAGAGVWMIAWRFPTGLMLPGALALAIAWLMRPRVGRVDPHATRLDRADAPALHGLIDQVATAIGAPPPDIVLIDARLNASASAVGVRRRRVLTLGLPLWGALGRQQRVALLGHELGHFVNGDVRRGLLTQPAFTTLAVAAEITTPDHLGIGGDGSTVGLLVMLSEKVVSAGMWLVSRVFLGAHLALAVLALRDAQRAEYQADQCAATAGGSAAAAELLDALIAKEAIDTVLRRVARAGGGLAQWRQAAAEAMADRQPRLALHRQASLRTGASLFASHPPGGLRAAMLAARPDRTAAVVLGAAADARIDAELAREAERTRRILADPESWRHHR